MTNETTITRQPGRVPCEPCGGDVGSPCINCGGCGSVPSELRCHCGRALTRYGWYFPDTRRLPRYRCTLGHLVAIDFTLAAERAAA